MLRRILCPNPDHIESTPSFVIYPNGVGHCFGCGYRKYSSRIQALYSHYGMDTIEAEDLEETFSYINTLPRKSVRGLLLPSDERSYYVCWPGDTYYKRRFLETASGPKYIGARGHKKPLFVLSGEDEKQAFIVEGEINALSVKEAFPGITVISPGGCGDFTSDKQDSYLQYYLSFSNIVVVMDSDNASREALIRFASKLYSRKGNQRISPITVDMDANDMLQQFGVQKLKDEFARYLDV